MKLCGSVKATSNNGAATTPSCLCHRHVCHTHDGRRRDAPHSLQNFWPIDTALPHLHVYMRGTRRRLDGDELLGNEPNEPVRGSSVAMWIACDCVRPVYGEIWCVGTDVWRSSSSWSDDGGDSPVASRSGSFGLSFVGMVTESDAPCDLRSDDWRTGAVWSRGLGLRNAIRRRRRSLASPAK
jgi:hypothetical protein